MNYLFLAQQSMLGLLPFVAMIVIIWFLIIRPQKKRQKEHNTMLEELKIGDKVITNGGINGVVANIKADKNIVTIKVSDNVKIDFFKSTIATKILKTGENENQK